MDTEMDFPAADELEWLEANALIPEDDEPPYGEEWTVEEQSAPTPQIPDSVNQTPRKRPAEDPENPEDGNGAKRRASTEEEEEEGAEDEDWLQYSPTKIADMPPEMEDWVPAVPEAIPEEMLLSRFASEIDGDCMPITGPLGDRVYAKLSSFVMDGGLNELVKEKPANGLLNEPIEVLINRIEQEAFAKALQESVELPGQLTHSTTPIVSEQLWVEKYAPKCFKELLSDEQTNREVLLWIKQWDSCVFGSQMRTTTDDVLSALRQHTSIAQHQKTSDSRYRFSKGGRFDNHNNSHSNVLHGESNKLNGVSDIPNRKPMIDHPLEQKVLLLCGPPGLGKTTLAHVAAKHCGYGVVEINASDDRSSSTLETKILNVMQMKSVMGDTRPKCLVIDEIDGALGEGKGAVEVILKMVAAEKKSTAENGKSNQEAQPGKTSRKGHKTAKLLRPVICICNDLYAPALRPLRQVAKVHTFVQPTISRVVNRLKYICKREGFKTGSTALSTLAEHTECDIRSCLNTLQFLHKKKQTLNILDVGSQVVGRKDMSRSAFDVWKEIFQKKKSKSNRKVLPGCSEFGEFDFLYSLISSCGEYELAMNGIHENFLRLSYHDPMMQKTVRCLDVLGNSDSLLQYIMRTHQMSLYVYQPPIAIAIRHLIAQIDTPNIEWPKSLHRCRTMLMEKQDLLKLWHGKIMPSISRHLSTNAFVEDVVSPFLHILSPPSLRPVALHLLSEREREHLSELVDTMVSYSISYKHAKSDLPQRTHTFGIASEVSVLSLDPPVGDFVKFEDYQSRHFGLSFAMKQFLVHEVEKHRILRESAGRSANLSDGINNEKHASPMVNVTPAPAPARVESSNTPTTAAFRSSSTPKTAAIQSRMIASAWKNSSSAIEKFQTIGTDSKTSGDSKKPASRHSGFFDRYRKGSGTGSKPGDNWHQAVTAERDSRPLLFKYNEGFTNAVKRPVKIRELLL